VVARFRIGTRTLEGSQAASKNGSVPASLVLMFPADFKAQYYLPPTTFRDGGMPWLL
jgi:hypothetical protein